MNEVSRLLKVGDKQAGRQRDACVLMLYQAHYHKGWSDTVLFLSTSL